MVGAARAGLFRQNSISILNPPLVPVNPEIKVRVHTELSGTNAGINLLTAI
jgi:hypothetical protein